MIPLDDADLGSRAKRIRLVVTDVDGVLTDAGVYYSDAGEVMKRFSIRDGMGVERLRAAGIETAFMTGERSESVVRRAEKLRVVRVHLGVKDKRGELVKILQGSDLNAGDIAYIGDDVNDLGIIADVTKLGLTAAPADAMPEVLAAVHFRCIARGGNGAFREFAEWILRSRIDKEPATGSDERGPRLHPNKD